MNPFQGMIGERALHGAVQDVLVGASHLARAGMKRVMGTHVGAVAAHGFGMHNPKNGIDCHPDPECPTCRRERR
jgi:hypothetical protein